MQDIDWFRDLQALHQLVGYKVKVDGREEAGVIHMVLGGPSETFFVIMIAEQYVYIDAKEPHRIDIVE